MILDMTTHDTILDPDTDTDPHHNRNLYPNPEVLDRAFDHIDHNHSNVLDLPEATVLALP